MKFLQGTTEIEIWHRLLGGNQESCSLQSSSKSMVTFYDTPLYCIWIWVKEKEMYKLFFYLHIEGYIEAVYIYIFFILAKSTYICVWLGEVVGYYLGWCRSL